MKTAIRSVTPQPGRSNGAFASGRPLFAEGENGFDPKEGGSITTHYNKHDEPWAVEIKDNDGYELTRIIRDYDTEGRLTSEKEIIEDRGRGFAEKGLALLPEQERTPEALQRVREQVRANEKVFADNRLQTYKYDDQNRVIKMSTETTIGVEEIEASYNEQGDVSEEKTTYSKDASSRPAGVAFHVDERGQLVPEKPESEWPEQPPLPEPSTTRYAYQYDSLGNWTERTTFFPWASEPVVQHRVFHYY